MAAFSLDPRLAADTTLVTDLALSRVLLMEDCRFPWLILVPRRPGLREIVDLDDAEAANLTAEIRLASSALIDLLAPHKLNVAALGNMVAQLHVHVIARAPDDAAWPRPVWGIGQAQSYEPATRQALIADLGRALAVP